MSGQLATDAILLGNLHKTYRRAGGDETAALAGITFTVLREETFGVLGASGSGKSTLLRLLAGFEAPTSGNVRIFGEEPTSIARRGLLGFMFQKPTLYPWLTVEQNVALPLRMLARLDNGTVRHYLSLVGLEGVEKSRPEELSGGMQQRAALARALSTTPRVLLLDEPFGALDEVTRLRLNLEVARILGQTAATTVLVTHSVTEVLLLADRIAILTPSSGTVRLIVSNPFPAPRGRVLLDKPEFHAIAKLLRERLE